MAERATEGLIKISEMAKLHGLSRQTLVLYDKNDLLKPAYISETGYRYYSIEQVPRLRSICFLKSMGIPLATIREHLDGDDHAGLLATALQNRRREIEAQIADLQRQEQSALELEQHLAHAMTMRKNIDVPYVEWFPERTAVYAPYGGDMMASVRLHLARMTAWDKLDHRSVPPSSGFGSLLSRAAVGTDAPLAGAGSIVMIPPQLDPARYEHVTLPAGEYATMYKVGMPYHVAPARRLRAWMGERGYEPAGDIVDICIQDAKYYDKDVQADFCRLEIRIA